MSQEVSNVVQICLLFHAFSILVLSTAIFAAIKDYRQSRFVDKETIEVMFSSLFLIAIFTTPIFLIAGSEIVSVLAVMTVIEVFICTLGYMIAFSSNKG